MCRNRHKYQASVFCTAVTAAMALGLVIFITGCPSSVPAPSDVVVGAQAILPELVITSPAEMIKLRKGQTLSITWKILGAQVLGEATITLVLDTTQQVTSNSILLPGAEQLDPSLGRYEFDTSTFGSKPGEDTGIAYYVIGALHAGSIPYSSDSSEGYLIVTEVDIAVLEPQKTRNSGLDSVLVAWDVTGGNTTDLVDVFADQDENPFNGNERLMIGDIPVEAGSIAVDFTLLEAGQYNVVCKLIRLQDGERQILDASGAAGKIVISNVYSGEYDLRTLSTHETRGYAPIDGVVFEGFSIGDQVGFEVAGVGDLDGDKKSEIVIFARFGQEYTGGNAGSAYLIYGFDAKAQTFTEWFGSPLVDLNSIPSVQAGFPLRGTLMMMPMANLAELEDGQVFGAYTAIGLPDVSADGKGDLLIGCPNAAPLTYYWANYTSSTITHCNDQYDLPREIPGLRWGYEPGHVPPQIEMNLKCGNSCGPYNLEYGAQLDDQHYLPGDTINIEYWEDGCTTVTVDHLRQNRGVTLLLTSQRLATYIDDVYELNKVGSPVEDGVSDVQPGWLNTHIMFKEGMTDRCEMITWLASSSGGVLSEELWGTSLSVVEDIDGDGFAEFLISAPEATVVDLADAGREMREKAGVVKMLGSKFRHSSIMTMMGTISWMVPEHWWALGGKYNGTPFDMDGPKTGRNIDIIGAQAGSRLTGAAGLGRFSSVEDFGGTYVGGDFNKDAMPDFVVGAPGEDDGAGAIYIIPLRAVFGRRTPQIDLADFNKAMPPQDDPDMDVPVMGVKLSGTVAGEHLGAIVKPAGDFNGDGLADVFFATPAASAGTKEQAGRVFLVFGSKDLLGDYTLDEVSSHLGAAVPALVFEGQRAGDMFGSRIAPAGDVNGDGLDDILIAAPQADDLGRTNCGKVYLIYGKSGIIKEQSGMKYVDYDDDGQGDDFWDVGGVGGARLGGAVFIGERDDDQLQAISSAGDVDGDGIGDLLLGAPYATPVNELYSDPELRKNAGKAYLIYGRKGD